MKYERLFSPLKIKNLELKNRVIMSAMHHAYTPEGYVTERFKEYYYRRAEGGVGLVMIGGCRFEEHNAMVGMVSIQDDSYIPGLKEFAEGMHKRGAKVGIQLFHGGRYSRPDANDGLESLAPSPVYSGYSRNTPREMTKKEIQNVIKRACDAAVRAVEANFDVVEIIASAGYLPCQFLSPLTNKRTDEYGGSWENRVRFAKELVQEMRKAVGEDFVLAMRLSGDDLVPGSNTNEDAVKFAKEMEKVGIDLLNITGGWHESKVPQITGELPRGGFSFLGAAIKEQVNIHVAMGNRINHPTVAERMLALEECDLVSVARPHVADPDWCKKAGEGEADTIRTCMACNQGCLANAFFDKPIECLVNGEVGREYLIKKLPKRQSSKKILVVGAGPGGCEFAIREARRGHEVHIWEAENKIGGQLHMVAMPPEKKEFLSLINYYEKMLDKLGVHVELQKTPDKKMIKEGAFDLVVVATGRGAAKNIDLDTDGSVTICTAYDILSERVMAGLNVLVIGGGSIGCETAQYLAREASISPNQIYHMLQYQYMPCDKVLNMMNSSRRNIAIVDIIKIGKGFKLGTGWPVIGDLARLGVKKYSFGSVKCIKEGMAFLEVKEDKDGKDVREIAVKTDTVVMAVGAFPERGLYDELMKEGMNVRIIGDAETPATIQDAVSAACLLAEELTEFRM